MILSRVEAIVEAKNAGIPYNKEPLSRLEEDLINLKTSQPPEIVSSFSEMTEEGVTYAILNAEEGEYNRYTEYMLINGVPERVGTQDTVVDAYTRSETDVLLSGKVNTEAGKGLSSNDYTTAEKEKLASIQPSPITVNENGEMVVTYEV